MVKIVLDTNILFSFFRDNPVRKIIINSHLLGLDLYIPEYALDELSNNKLELIKYSKLNKEQVEEAMKILANFAEIKELNYLSFS